MNIYFPKIRTSTFFTFLVAQFLGNVKMKLVIDFGFYEIIQTVEDRAKIAVRTSFPSLVSQFFTDTEMSRVVVDSFL